MAQYDWKNCPVPIRGQLERLCSGILQTIPGNGTGIYLHGSLAMGCFNPQRSDLDLLVVTRTATTEERKPALARLLLEYSRQPAPLEIHFLHRSQLQPWQYPTPFDFHFSESWRERFEAALSDGSWQIFTDFLQADEDLGAHVVITRRRGICLHGYPIPDIFPEVPAKDYLDSILKDVLSNEFGLNSTFENPATVILNACRTLAYLKTGEVLSKDEGGDWALWSLPEEIQPVVLKALCAYRSSESGNPLPGKWLQQFGVFMRDQLAHAVPRN